MQREEKEEKEDYYDVTFTEFQLNSLFKHHDSISSHFLNGKHYLFSKSTPRGYCTHFFLSLPLSSFHRTKHLSLMYFSRL